MSDIDDLLPFPVRIQEYETDSVTWFERASEIERHFGLSEPLDADDLGEILEIAREGVVHAAINPFVDEIWSERCLLLAASAENLDYRYGQACDDI